MKTERKENRPWGYFVVYADEENHKVKRIAIYPGKRLSLQKHFKRAEHWYILSGRAIVTIDGKNIELGPGESIDLPCGCVHRMANESKSELAFIEVQTGTYFGEDDIQRFEDDFGRS